MEKDVAITMLEDIEQSLQGKNAKGSGLKTVEIYRKDLEISTNKKIRKLIDKQMVYVQKYGRNGRKTLKLNKKIDEEIRKIFNS